MAWFTYKCNKCDRYFRVSISRRQPEYNHKGCIGVGLPVLKAATSQIVDVLDNGIMPRRVERMHDIEEIMEDRNDKFREQTEKKTEDDE
jgi:hypothetical protein